MSKNFTHGCDPEFFATYKKNDNLYALSPAMLAEDCGAEILGGTEKHPIFISTENYNWIMDGVAFELNLKKPYKNPVDMWVAVNSALLHLEDYLSGFSHPEFGELFLVKKPTVNIEPKIYLPRMNNQRILQGFIFGCDPDEDAFDAHYNCKTVSVEDYLFRHGGGHLHFGNNFAFNYIQWFIKFLAITVGNFCIAESPFLNEEKTRVNTYGKAGRFRPQEYGDGSLGVEYRSPSNGWVSFSKDKIEELFYWANKAFEYLKDERVDIIDEQAENSRQAIATADQFTCREILRALP